MPVSRCRCDFIACFAGVSAEPIYFSTARGNAKRLVDAYQAWSPLFAVVVSCRFRSYGEGAKVTTKQFGNHHGDFNLALCLDSKFVGLGLSIDFNEGLTVIAGRGCWRAWKVGDLPAMHKDMKIPKRVRERCRRIEAVVTAVKTSRHVVKIETLGRSCDGDSSVRKID